MQRFKVSMQPHKHKRKDYNLNSNSFGQNKGPSLQIEYKKSSQQRNIASWWLYPVSISWPFVAQHSAFAGQTVFEVEYLHYPNKSYLCH